MTSPTLPQLVRRADIPAIDALLAHPHPTSHLPSLLTALHNDGHSALHWAAMSDHPTLLRRLLPLVPSSIIDVRSTAPAQLDQTPLHWACVAGNVNSVRALLNAGARPFLHDAKRYNAPIHAAQYGHIDVLHVLLDLHPSLRDSIDLTGNCLLQWAAYYDHHPAVRYLTAVHALPPDSADLSHTTALHRAARADRIAVCDVLLRAGADPSVKDGHGRTPLQLATPHSPSALLLADWLSASLTVESPSRNRHLPSRYSLVVFYYLLLISSYYLYNVVVIPQSPLPAFLHVISHICVVISVFSHLRATFRDPGDIPRGSVEDFVAYIDNSIKRGDSSIALLPSAYCFTCLVQRPVRSKHSRHRDVCVRRFDHECPWVNNSVGLYTHKPLLYLVASTATVQIIFICAVLRLILVHTRKPHVSALAALTQHPFLVLLVFLNLAVALFCVTLLFTHLRLIARGFTTYEAITIDRNNKSPKSDYDKGACHNFLAFMSSTGPGTGKPYNPITISSIFSAVMASRSFPSRTPPSSAVVDDNKHLLKSSTACSDVH